MYCPECRGEYREGFVECADCAVPLVAGLPPAEPAADSVPVTVFAAGDPARIALAESLLLDAGIPFVKEGEGIQDLLGGRFAGFDQAAGPVRFVVPGEHAEAARAVLAEPD